MPGKHEERLESPQKNGGGKQKKKGDQGGCRYPGGDGKQRKTKPQERNNYESVVEDTENVDKGREEKEKEQIMTNSSKQKRDEANQARGG